jgi:hypothetical protein
VPSSVSSNILKLPACVALPEMFTTPVPSGAKVMSPFEVDTIELVLTSKLPPNCGVVSSTTFANLPLI